MTSRWSYGRIAHLLLWSGLALALLTVSIPRIYSGATEYPLRPGGALHTTDSYLKFATGAEGASGQVIAIFDSMPMSKPIVIFTRKDDAFSSGLGMTTAYLAAPHAVRLCEINGTHPDHELSLINPNKVAAVVLCRLQRPAWLPRGKTLGSGLEIVSLADKARQ
jgi:hypothetical protein